jgi:hypothetical protein
MFKEASIKKHFKNSTVTKKKKKKKKQKG